MGRPIFNVADVELRPRPAATRAHGCAVPMTPDLQILIIGGGLSGLSAALHLARAGAEDLFVLKAERIGQGGNAYLPGTPGPPFPDYTKTRTSRATAPSASRPSTAPPRANTSRGCSSAATRSSTRRATSRPSHARSARPAIASVRAWSSCATRAMGVRARLENGETAAHAVVGTNGFIIGRDANLQGRMRSYWTFHVAFDDPGENTPNADYFDRTRTTGRARTTSFAALMGVSPARYLARWRMHLASRWLRQDRFTVAQVAERLGYESEPGAGRLSACSASRRARCGGSIDHRSSSALRPKPAPVSLRTPRCARGLPLLG
ncbi:MAG TPA: helix-turn-helix domain-containing protein [Burkholderiales bacterium]|nr:helix-turn-helix domain-containing protein [Burkholderiales bacterium]